MRKRKEGMRGSKLSTRGFLSRGSVSHEGILTSTLLKQSQRVLLFGNQVSSVDTTTVTLIPFSTKELAHAGWGLHVPRTMSLTPLHTKPEGH